MLIHLILPHPISTNKAYAWYPRRHKSKEYVEWEREAEKAMRTQTKYSIEGDEWLSMTYILYTPLYCKNGKKKKIDIANYEKTTTDFLCHHIPWLEDHKILTFTGIKKEVDDKGKRIEIFIEEVWSP